MKTKEKSNFLPSYGDSISLLRAPFIEDGKWSLMPVVFCRIYKHY